MADDSASSASGSTHHRGRIQAQGGGTEKSESWAQSEPPTETEMLSFCDRLECHLTNQEQKDREQGLRQLPRFIRAAARAGGVSAPASRSWYKRGSKDIRIDLKWSPEWPVSPIPDGVRRQWFSPFFRIS
jgi:hypothetical protein